jgi:copper chaperone CopZ
MTQAALKLLGPWEVRRKFRIPALSDTGGAAHVEQALNQVAGVKGVAIDVDHHLVKVRYEPTETDYTTISNAVGLPPQRGCWGIARLACCRAWI